MEARDGKTKRAGTKWRPYCVISIASTVQSGPVQVIDKEQSRHSRATGMVGTVAQCRTCRLPDQHRRCLHNVSGTSQTSKRART
jgi:hypothetical protein